MYDVPSSANTRHAASNQGLGRCSGGLLPFFFKSVRTKFSLHIYKERFHLFQLCFHWISWIGR